MSAGLGTWFQKDQLMYRGARVGPRPPKPSGGTGGALQRIGILAWLLLAGLVPTLVQGFFLPHWLAASL